jgi:hypothetical protein
LETTTALACARTDGEVVFGEMRTGRAYVAIAISDKVPWNYMIGFWDGCWIEILLGGWDILESRSGVL